MLLLELISSAAVYQRNEWLGIIRQLSMARLLAESIRRVSNEESISAMFDNA
jgi:phosphoribosylpyrophosphate synthetase